MKRIYIFVLICTIGCVMAMGNTYAEWKTAAQAQMPASAFPDSMAAGLARADSADIANDSWAIDDTNQLGTRLGEKLEKEAFEDSLGNPHTGIDITADEFFGSNLN